MINASALQSVLDTMAVCKVCKKSNLKLYELGKKASCTSRLLLKCSKCFSHKIFWSFSGFFGSTKISVGNIQIAKRNYMVYSSILGGRLIGIGHNSLSHYHNSINIPLPPSGPTYVDSRYCHVLAAEEIAKLSMDTAKKVLCNLHEINESENVYIVTSYDGAYLHHGGKAGGGHSWYAFASAISTEIAKMCLMELPAIRVQNAANSKINLEMVKFLWKNLIFS